MSIFLPRAARCGTCGTPAPVSLAASINADRRPDLRQQVLDGSFQATECPRCGAAMRLPAHLTYLDVGRGQWILVEDVAKLDDWALVEAQARTLHDQTFGPATPDAAQEIGDALQSRLVFGWPALREKLLAAELGLDDIELELLKVAILRSVPGPALSDGTELRLHAGDTEALRFRWLRSASEEAISELRVGRETYDALAGDPAPWRALREELAGCLFVDMARIIRAEAGPAPGRSAPMPETVHAE